MILFCRLFLCPLPLSACRNEILSFYLPWIPIRISFFLFCAIVAIVSIVQSRSKATWVCDIKFCDTHGGLHRLSVLISTFRSIPASSLLFSKRAKHTVYIRTSSRGKKAFTCRAIYRSLESNGIRPKSKYIKILSYTLVFNVVRKYKKLGHLPQYHLPCNWFRRLGILILAVI